MSPRLMRLLQDGTNRTIWRRGSLQDFHDSLRAQKKYFLNCEYQWRLIKALKCQPEVYRNEAA